ncbi:MarR family transcriptional regulator [Suttonella ornithocola]|uniref:Multiple antibiotic resistance protein marR n=1 Tax=Suttonella ornithocola TaxID=279832 RepID=A0A380MNR3_9GAMM|nr:MarR family transcriptional regulator [Suttonella ornithocola]SUO93898.1 Multiple antibiotic resistance protein marR [Suttonella ornithocola]
MKIPTQAFVDALENVRKHLPEMDTRPQTLINMRMLRRVSANSSQYFNRILSEFNLNDTMFYALIMLYRCDGEHMQPSTLSEILDLTRTSATRLADDLVSRGWVNRQGSTKDRRSILLKLSPSGMKLVETLTPKLAQARLSLWEDFSDGEIQQFQFLMKKLLQRLEQENLS